MVDEDGAKTGDGKRVEIEVWIKVFQFIRHFV
jgi:hypothetical protein